MESSSQDMQRTVELYDPHPGMAGAGAPLQSSVKDLIDSIVGKKMVLQDAVDKIQSVAQGTVEVVWQYSFIGLTSGPHMWRVVRFR